MDYYCNQFFLNFKFTWGNWILLTVYKWHDWMAWSKTTSKWTILTIQFWYFVENSFDVSDTEKTQNAFIPFKRKGENRGFDAMGYIQFPVLDTNYSLLVLLWELHGVTSWQMVLMSPQGIKIKDLRIFWQYLPFIWRGPLENIPFKDNVFCLKIKALWFSFRNGQLHARTNRWRCPVKSQISLNSEFVQCERNSFSKQHFYQQEPLVNVFS